jgi:hypothetical protein
MRLALKIMKLLFILSWIPLLLLKLVLALLGLVVIPLALWFKMDMVSLPVWGNREEGCPDWWLRMAKDKSWFVRTFPTFFWFAVRNPVNNMRYILEDTDDYHMETNWHVDRHMEPAELQQENQKMAFAWRWTGWKSGYRRVWLNSNTTYSEIWFGFKLGSSVPGLGFTSQVRLKRKIGT